MTEIHNLGNFFQFFTEMIISIYMIKKKKKKKIVNKIHIYKFFKNSLNKYFLFYPYADFICFI